MIDGLLKAGRPLLLLVVFLAGCAAGGRYAKAPDVAAELPAAEQLQKLEDRIALGRALLGLPSREAVPGAADVAPPGAAPAAAGATMSAPAQRAEVEAAPAPTAEAAAPPESGAGKDRCGGVCRASRDICGYGERICRLAAGIGDEPSKRSCVRARADCAEASKACSTCR